ncbi:hypothetical protein WJ438_03270 [Streptomyces sp. GD-15H]|uniref:hypothetical protein n=1 Tax=Streptomyces sp. GD-15H TaxID=3129112 RepID=UPI0032449CF9
MVAALIRSGECRAARGFSDRPAAHWVGLPNEGAAWRGADVKDTVTGSSGPSEEPFLRHGQQGAG